MRAAGSTGTRAIAVTPRNTIRGHMVTLDDQGRTSRTEGALPILKRVRTSSWPAGRLNLAVMSTAFLIFGLSLIFQSHRWHSTPAYHVLLEPRPYLVRRKVRDVPSPRRPVATRSPGMRIVILAWQDILSYLSCPTSQASGNIMKFCGSADGGPPRAMLSPCRSWRSHRMQSGWSFAN